MPHSIHQTSGAPVYANPIEAFRGRGRGGMTQRLIADRQGAYEMKRSSDSEFSVSAEAAEDSVDADLTRNSSQPSSLPTLPGPRIKSGAAGKS